VKIFYKCKVRAHSLWAPPVQGSITYCTLVCLSLVYLSRPVHTRCRQKNWKQGRVEGNN